MARRLFCSLRWLSALGWLSCLGIHRLAALGLSHPGHMYSYVLSFTRSLIPQQTSLFKCQGQGSKGETGSVQGFPKPNLELEQGHLHHSPLDKARSPGNPYSRCWLIDSPSEWAEVQSHCQGHGSSSRQRAVCCPLGKTNPCRNKRITPNT